VFGLATEREKAPPQCAGRPAPKEFDRKFGELPRASKRRQSPKLDQTCPKPREPSQVVNRGDTAFWKKWVGASGLAPIGRCS